MTMYPLARLRAVAALAVTALALTGCASMHVSSYVERGVDLRQYRTYAWGPADTFSTGDPRLDDNPFFDGRVRAAVENHLAARGFERMAGGAPDLLVHYHASVAQQIYARDIDRQYGYCDDGDCRPEVYDEGTLLIDLIDTRTNTLVWRGWAEDSFEGVVENQDWMEAEIDEAVARILETLPRGL
jgi:hypothetical protein